MKFLKVQLLFIIVMLLHGSMFASSDLYPTAQKGVLDLRTWDFDNNGEIKLDGEWEMYWERLFTPTDFSNRDFKASPVFFNLPNLWNKHKINGKKLNGNGYSTFRLKILLPDSYTQFACKLGRIETAYKLFINNEEYIHKGSVGKSRDEMKPRWNPTTFHFKTDSNIIHVILQISNFYHKKGGISDSILLGTPTQIANKQAGKNGYELFILGILLIMAMYHFALFSLRKKDQSPLFFGLFCLFTGIHMMVNGEIQLTNFFPGISWEWIMKFNFIANYLRVPAFAFFIAALFKDEVSTHFKKFHIYAFPSLSLFVLITKARIYTYSLDIAYILIAYTILYLIFVLFKASFHNKNEAQFSLIGLFIILVSFLNDMFHEKMVIQTMYIMPFGLFIFIFFQSFMLSMHSSKAYKSIENLTKRLMTLDKIKNEFISSNSYSLSSPLKILMENIGVDRGFLILQKDGKWVIEAKKVFPDLEAKCGVNVELDYAGGRAEKPLLSDSVVKQVIRKRENILLNDPLMHEKFKDDPYIVHFKPRSIYCMSLKYRSKLKGVLYLEINKSENTFTEENVTILDLVSSQIATLIDNAEIFWELEILNKNLEKKVEERTHEIILQKEEILAQRDEIENKNKFLQNAYDEIAIKNRDITDSINYAKRIQTSVLPPFTHVKDIVPESFILFKPKDILSGDFYWVEKYMPSNGKKSSNNYNSEHIIAAAVDCTGHGVPGALLSIMGYNLINNIISEYEYTKPSDILNILQKAVKNYLRQEDDDMLSKDGMDLALVSYEKSSKTLQFSGARNPLYLIRDNNLNIIKGDKQSIGGFISRKYKGKSFTNHEIKIEKNDYVYIFSDGYVDQFGGPKKMKFTPKAFGNLLLSIHDKPLEEQKEILNETIENWKNGQKQIDDILVMGFRFSSVK